MALISHKHELIFFKTIKTAGTSVEDALAKSIFPNVEERLNHQYAGPDGIIGAKGDADKVSQHPFWNHMPAALLRDNLGKDKFDRYHKVTTIRNPFDKVVSHFLYTQNRKGGAKDMEDFRTHIKTCRNVFSDRYIYAIDDHFAFDEALRFENIQEDFSNLLARYGLPEVMLPHHKQMNRDTIYKDYYDTQSAERVAQRYAPEIERFGYTLN